MASESIKNSTENEAFCKDISVQKDKFQSQISNKNSEINLLSENC